MYAFLLAAASVTTSPVRARIESQQEQTTDVVVLLAAGLCISFALYIFVDAFVVRLKQRRRAQSQMITNEVYVFPQSAAAVQDSSENERPPGA
jgi:hypothetical protein